MHPTSGLARGMFTQHLEPAACCPYHVCCDCAEEAAVSQWFSENQQPQMQPPLATSAPWRVRKWRDARPYRACSGQFRTAVLVFGVRGCDVWFAETHQEWPALVVATTRRAVKCSIHGSCAGNVRVWFLEPYPAPQPECL